MQQVTIHLHVKKIKTDFLHGNIIIFWHTTGHTYFSDATGHTSPSGYVACWWLPINPFCVCLSL